ncbi:MAG: hypothetical protein H0U23_14755 [Blastocatellia bacterium]|nr:hypothetical protein [Blastocatellia bacterium]
MPHDQPFALIAALVVVLAFTLVPTSIQLSSESGDIVAASYTLGLGWWAMGLWPLFVSRSVSSLL